MSIFDLSGRIAVVTGASRGIGLAIASGLRDSGAIVIGIARSSGLKDIGYQYRICDVTNPILFKKNIEEIYSDYGHIDILVNAAGITMPSGLNEKPSLLFQDTIQTNLTAVFECCSAVFPFMRMGGFGSIINVSSIGAMFGFPGNPAYIASKGGVSALTRALAIDYGVSGVRVNNLVPGYIRTSMTQKSFDNPHLRAAREGRTILGRFGEANELAGAAIFLSSDASSYITGIDLVVDGGWKAKGL